MLKRIFFSKKTLITIFFIAFFYSIFTKIFNFTNSIDNLKYILFLLNLLLDCIYIYYNKVQLKLKREYLYILLLSILLFFVSLIIAIMNHSFISFRTIIEIIYILLPASCAFCIINIFTLNEIISYIKLLLFFSLIAYFIELAISNISINDVLKISFLNSYSPFESYIFADVSVFCFCFFSYFKESDQKNNFIVTTNQCYYISFLFVIMTFKRILVLFAICLFIFNLLKIKDLVIPKKIIYILLAILFVSTVFYTWLLEGHNSKILMDLFSINLEKFTVGRQWYFSIVEANSHFLNGYGSSTNILSNVLGEGKYLEMDLVKIYIETGPIVLAFFIYAYWRQIYNNLFSLIVFFFLFINMLFSHSLTTFYAWILFFLLFYTIKINFQMKKGETK